MYLDTHAKEVLSAGDRLMAIEKKRVSTYSIDFKQEAQTFDIPFFAKTAQLLPSDDLSLAYITERGDVVLASQASTNKAASSVITLLPPEKKQLTLFEDVFTSLKVDEEPINNTASLTSSSGVPNVLDQPSHLLPPMQMIWREAILLPTQASLEGEAQPQLDPMDLDPVDESAAQESAKALPIRIVPARGDIISSAFLSQLQGKK
jgi:hypothetical protein